MSNFLFLGYKYDDVEFSITPEDAKFYKEGVLGVRDYILDGHSIQISLKPTNRNEGDPDFYYSAKAKVLPAEKQTEASIGTLYVAQMDENCQKLSVEEVNMVELDNSHVIDLLMGTVFRIHYKSFGPGPYQPKVKKPKASPFKK